MGPKVEQENKKDEKKLPQSQERPISERFTYAVMKEFNSITGSKLELTPMQKRLAQHLFLRIDAALGELERKRLDKGTDGTPIVWANINMPKLAIDAMNRIELGLDALIPNHISPIPYFNKRAGKYDLDLRIGYVGKDFYRRAMAIEQPMDIRYELVHENDVFEPIKKSHGNAVESYKFQIEKPFNRGKIVGGFAYIIFKDESKNTLIIVTEEDFKKSESKAQSKEFWGGYPVEMRYKTLVTRATSKLQIDSEKVNAAFLAVEKEEDIIDAAVVQSVIEEKANSGVTVAISGDPEKVAKEVPAKTKEPENTQMEPGDEAGTEEKPNGRRPDF
jgi:recombination protein RecT